jgi:transposase
LIVDNAAVHYGTDIYEIVIFALESVGAKLIFLPAYSPELNPCELCFAIVKQYIRRRLLNQDIPIWAKVIFAISKISTEMLEHFYFHCITPPVVFPEFR